MAFLGMRKVFSRKQNLPPPPKIPEEIVIPCFNIPYEVSVPQPDQ